MSFLKSESYLGPTLFPIQSWKHLVFIPFSFLLVALGQPAWCSVCGLIASVIGFALFWRSMWGFPSIKHQFWLATAWFTGIQLFQLSWMLTHPYYYIFGVWIFFSFFLGLQFGILSYFVRPNYVFSLWKCAALAGIWAILEWSRLFFMSGFTWNPVGLALSGNLFSIQSVAIAGVYGMSFWAIFTNLLVLRFWLLKKKLGAFLAALVAAIAPYIYGYGHFIYNSQTLSGATSADHNLTAILVQPAFPIEENLPFKTTRDALSYVHGEWKQILQILKKHLGKKIDLIVFPECTVPYGTYSPIFTHKSVTHDIQQILGHDAVLKLPDPQEPFAEDIAMVTTDPIKMVSNAYWAQSISNIFDASVLIGLEDHQYNEDDSRQSFISAQYFVPRGYESQRYDKRVLLPMGEYIPSEWLKNLASSYGVVGSYSPGDKAKVFQCRKIPVGVSICYEETFGDLMRGNKHEGAQVLANLTSDIWYPHSALPQQHFDHARLRAIELGMPLIRSCNTGITGAVDSFGRTIAVLGTTPEEQHDLSDALYIDVPIHHYPTLYSHFGDKLIITLSTLLALCFFLKKDD